MHIFAEFAKKRLVEPVCKQYQSFLPIGLKMKNLCNSNNHINVNSNSDAAQIFNSQPNHFVVCRQEKKYWFWLKFVWHPWICPSKGYVESDELHIWQISDCLNKTTIYRWKMLLEIISRFFYFKNKIVRTKKHSDKWFVRNRISVKYFRKIGAVFHSAMFE